SGSSPIKERSRWRPSSTSPSRRHWSASPYRRNASAGSSLKLCSSISRRGDLSAMGSLDPFPSARFPTSRRKKSGYAGARHTCGGCSLAAERRRPGWGHGVNLAARRPGCQRNLALKTFSIPRVPVLRKDELHPFKYTFVRRNQETLLKNTVVLAAS